MPRSALRNPSDDEKDPQQQENVTTPVRALSFSAKLHVRVLSWALQGKCTHSFMDCDPCPQALYWQSRAKSDDNGSSRPCPPSSRGNVDDDYWKEASVSDHVSNASLELCFWPPNERLILRLLHAAVAAPGCERDVQASQARARVRALYMLGEAAERAGDTTLAKQWYKRSAASPHAQYVQARLKLINDET